MTELLFLLLWFMRPLEEVPALEPYAVGYATRYDPGVAQAVMRRRIRYYDQLHPWYGYVPDCLCALNDNHLDEYILVFPQGKKRLLCYVVDVAQRKHKEEREEQNLVVELDYDSWQKVRHSKVVVVLLRRKDARP